MRLFNIDIDAISFWVGAAVASLFWFIAGRARPTVDELRQKWEKRRSEVALRESDSVADRHRQATLKEAQGMHLASPLFALDEILIPPRLVAPPPQIVPGDDYVAEGQTDLTVPYLPNDSRLAAFYRTASLSLAEALSSGMHLAVVGPAGTGKTVALAHLATMCAKRDPQLGNLANGMPFLCHIADLNIDLQDENEPLEPLIAYFSSKVSLFHAPRIPKFMRAAFEQGRALLLLDGLDELPQNEMAESVAYLQRLIKAYPAIRVVTTADTGYLDQLSAYNFAILTIQQWTREEQKRFLAQWGRLWEEFVSLEAWAQTGPEPVEGILLNAWLYEDSLPLSPLELTLQAWGIYAGDGRGGTALAAIETHLRRLSPREVPVAALETLAMQVSLNEKPVFDARDAKIWIKSFELPEEEVPSDAINEDDVNEDEATEKEENTAQKEIKPGRSLLAKIQESGLLSQHGDSRLRFSHPVFCGYLAGRGLSAYELDSSLVEQPRWSGQTLALHYLAALGDPSSAVHAFLTKTDPVVERNLLQVGGWLKDAPFNQPWRGKALTRLATILQDDTRPLGLRGQIIAQLALSGDPNIAKLFRQLLQSSSAYVIQLAALGSGLMQDKKAVDPLSHAMANTNNGYTLSAICLALAAIGTDDALETLASALLEGDENLRRAAAEAFANHPGEGWETLKEALEFEDILLRRAAVYGLARIEAPWARELLKRTQIEDSEWAVRDIAASMLERGQTIAGRLPRKLKHPAETPWLISFASKEDMGISPSKPATDLLLRVLKSENPDESLAVLPYLRRIPSEGVIAALYGAMNGGSIEMRERIFVILVEIAASGITLPDPKRYGLA